MKLKIFFLIIPFGVLAYNDSGKEVVDSYVRRDNGISAKYDPTWESLDSRPLPEWYDDVKFGIFVHWGVYAVPGFGSEWFWSNWKGLNPSYVKFMFENYPPGFTYQQFAPEFKAQFFNATEWAEIFHGSGAKYVVLTSKHHEGYTLWPSSRAFSWNAMDVGPRRDLVKELSNAVRAQNDMHFGVYYSLYEWYNPMYIADKTSKFQNQTYVVEKMLPELHELINKYHPEVLWTDGDWEAEYDYFKSTEFLAWLYNESPVKDTIVANDRWGRDIPCNHGGFYTCTDRYNPGVLQNHKWENCMTIDKKSWGFRKNAKLSDFLTVHQLITELVSTVSCGGNLLMNVGPTKDGTIAPVFQDRLQSVGKWLDVNGEAIYKTKPWIYQNDTVNSDVWYTAAKAKLRDLTLTGGVRRLVKDPNSETVFAVALKWPTDNTLRLGALAKRLNKRKTNIEMLNDPDIQLQWTEGADGVQVKFPDMATVKSQDAWTLKITDVDSKHV
ncbi:alpha-L-fucosidase [Arctopsyche grandis]|uniref:alpha-L-fucosidase n=1 Tax=Arctopsyche grandis TaxID=121162 RepID=UPI00406D7B69